MSVLPIVINTPDPQKVAIIVADLQGGDGKTALKFLHQLYYKKLTHYCITIIKDPDEAHDIVTDSFVKLWELKEGFDNLGQIKAFLNTIVQNASLSYLRRLSNRNRIYRDLLQVALFQENYLENALIQAEFFNLIRRELEDLPAGCKTVCQLAIFEGLSSKEIAEKLGLSVTNVSTQKRKGYNLINSAFIRKRLIIVFWTYPLYHLIIKLL